MLPGRGRRGLHAPRRPATGADGGFTLLEVLVSLALIGTMTAALTTFFVRANAAARQQGGRQTAAQVATDAVETARAISNADLVSTLTALVTGSGGTASTAPGPPWTFQDSRTVGGTRFDRGWLVEMCWQDRTATSADCTPTKPADPVEFFLLTVTVTWADVFCAAPGCSFRTTTLISSQVGEPIFNLNDAALSPTITDPGNMAVNAGFPLASYQFQVTQGEPPLTWSNTTALPAGVTLRPDGVLEGTPTAGSVGSYPVTVRVVDGFANTDTTSFTLTVNTAPLAVDPGHQDIFRGTAISPLALGVTGGTAPFTWSTTALPAGLSLNSGTGVISGTPTTLATTTVTATVTDRFNKSDSTTFTMAVHPLPTAVHPGNKSTIVTTAATPVTLGVTGGSSPFTWSTTALPAGLTLNGSSGVISGTPNAIGTTTVTATVTDRFNKSAATTFTWTVTPVPLSITRPADQSSPRKTTITPLKVQAAGGTQPYSWTISGQPPGLSINSSTGYISGNLTNTWADYTVTVTVTDAAGTARSTSFMWTVEK